MATVGLPLNLDIIENSVEDANSRFVIIAIITGIVNFIGLLLIVNCPFSAIGAYKYHLLNILICGCIMDLHISLLFMPIPLLPMAGFCSFGWPAQSGRFFGVHIQFAIFMWLFGIYGLSLVVAILYHMSKILGAKTILKSKKGVVYGFLLQMFYSIPCCIFYLILTPDEQSMLGYVSLKAPLSSTYIKSHSCSVLIPDTVVYLFIGVTAFMGCICSIAVFLCSGLAVLLLLRNRAAKNSAEYLKFKTMTIGLLAQLIIPWSVILIPVLWVCLRVWTAKDNPAEYTSIMFQVISCHSIINVLVMIIFTTPLRKTFPKIFPADSTQAQNNSTELFERRQTPGRNRSATTHH